MSLTADDIVKLFEKDVRARKRLAELLVIEPDIRLAIINAVLRDIATKRDIELVREGLRKEIEELRRDIEELRREISQLREKASKVEGQLSLLIKLFIAFNLPILIALIGILLKMIFTP